MPWNLFQLSGGAKRPKPCLSFGFEQRYTCCLNFYAWWREYRFPNLIVKNGVTSVVKLTQLVLPLPRTLSVEHSSPTIQGAIAAIYTEVSVEGSAFTSNTAAFGAGGGIYCSTSVASFDGSLFTANKAELGGGGCSTSILCRWLMPEAVNCPRHGCFCSASSVVLCFWFSRTSSKSLESWFLSLGHEPSRSNLVCRLCCYFPPCQSVHRNTCIPGLGLFSTGSVWSQDRPSDTGPANTTSCVFERNTATDGGGIYSADGYDIIRDCQFEENLAGGNIVQKRELDHSF